VLVVGYGCRFQKAAQAFDVDLHFFGAFALQIGPFFIAAFLICHTHEHAAVLSQGTHDHIQGFFQRLIHAGEHFNGISIIGVAD